MKRCSKCGVISSNFCKHPGTKDGLQSNCNDCKNKVTAKFNTTEAVQVMLGAIDYLKQV